MQIIHKEHRKYYENKGYLIEIQINNKSILMLKISKCSHLI